MSAPEPTALMMEVVQVAPWHGGEPQIAARLRAAGWELPDSGQVWAGPDRLACCVRPGRWLLIDTTPVRDGADLRLAAICESAVGDAGAVTDLSAARRAWRVTDPRAREWLAAGCRLDLHPHVFPPGRAAVTLIAQVPVMIVALSDGWLLMAPSSMAEHVGTWLSHAAHTPLAAP